MGVFSIQDEPNIVYAQKIMFDEKYLQTKAKIMQPIDEFIIQIDERTNNTVQNHRRKGYILLSLSIILLIVGILISLISYYLVKKRLIAQIKADIALKKQSEILKKQINEITRGVAVLSSTISEITAATSELAASSTENASSISETTTTIEELKQTAQVASEKAKEISESSKKNIQVANEGEKAVELTSAGMSRIREQMESIVESIMKLSEQNQSIGDIMNSINDLAEQSNLLAVNAAIEAAKAGEEGKGFSVVATEVKNLAEQSKQATQQVRGILTDIQKAISNAALATEEGNKVVETGLKQSTEAGTSIKTLADVIEKATDNTSQIAVSVQEQSVGIDQINEAIRNIGTSSTQNLESTKQLESASKGLEELGNNLKKLMEQHKEE